MHLYGKDLRPGRKVGHVNAYGDDLDDCLERARHAAAWFRGDLGNESEWDMSEMHPGRARRGSAS